MILSHCTTTLIASVLSLAATNGQDNAQSIEQRLAAITRAVDRFNDESLHTNQRAIAIDEALELRTQLLNDEPTDRRRASWHADQAENILLQRIEFPSSFSAHLLNADPACPLLPPAIPRLVAAGLQHAATARANAGTDLRAIEDEGNMLEDPDVLSLAQTLAFERDVRAPLLEAIALTLASRSAPDAAASAVGILNGLANNAKSMATRRVANHWLRLAQIEAEKKKQVRRFVADLPNPLDVIRARAIIDGPKMAAAAAKAKANTFGGNERYARLLLGDLRERYLAADAAQATSYSPERGDVWIALLDGEDGQKNWTLDNAIAARLTRTGKQFRATNAEVSLPLAYHWAHALEDLSRRQAAPSSNEQLDSTVMADLESALDNASDDDPTIARSMHVLAQLATLEGDRRTAARFEQQLFETFPLAPVSDPSRVVALLRPLALRGDVEVNHDFELALRAVAESSDHARTDEHTRLSHRIELARFFARTNRTQEAIDVHKAIAPSSLDLAADNLEAYAACVLRMQQNGTVEKFALRELLTDLAAAQRALHAQFGSAAPRVVGAAAATRLATYRVVLAMDDLRREPDAIERLDAMMSNGTLPMRQRLEAHVLRHEYRLHDTATHQAAVKDAPDLIAAMRLDRGLAARLLLASAAIELGKIDASRAIGRHLDADSRAANRIRPIAFALGHGIPPQSSPLDRMTLARTLQEGKQPEAALAIWNALSAEFPQALDVLRGRADALFQMDDDRDALAKAMRIYTRIGKGRPGPQNPIPADAWWEAQVRQLQILEKVGSSLDKIRPKIERLRILDPQLGGPRSQEALGALSHRMRSSGN